MTRAQKFVENCFKSGLLAIKANDGQPVKPRIKAGFRNEGGGICFLYINGMLVGYNTPEYIYFKGKKIFP